METDPNINQVDEPSSNVQIKHYEFTRFSKFEKVGTGAYKKLYRAISENDDMTVALKPVDNKYGKEILNEIKLQVNVNHHPNIIRFYGITEVSSFFVDFVNDFKEEHVPGTPENYIQIYTECWQSNSSRRPEIEEVANSLKRLMSSHHESVSVTEKINDRESKKSIVEKYSKTKEQVKTYNLIFDKEFIMHKESNIIRNERLLETQLEFKDDNKHLQEMQVDLNLAERVDSKVIAHQSVDDYIQPFGPLFNTVAEIVSKMITICETAECSKKICSALLFRAEIAQTCMKHLQRKRQANAKNFRRQEYYLIWVKFTNVLKNMMIFTEEIAQLSWFRKFSNINMVIDAFYANIVEFEDSCYDLDLTVGVYSAEQREKEAQDVAYDILILKKSMDGMQPETKTLTTEIAALNAAKHSLKNATPEIIASNVPRKVCKIPRINSEELFEPPPSKDNNIRGSIMKKIFQKGFVYVNMDETFRWLAPERMKNPIPRELARIIKSEDPSSRPLDLELQLKFGELCNKYVYSNNSQDNRTLDFELHRNRNSSHLIPQSFNGTLFDVSNVKAELYIKLATLKNQSRAAEFLEKIHKESTNESVSREIETDDSKTIAIIGIVENDDSKTIVINEAMVIERPVNEALNVEESTNEMVTEETNVEESINEMVTEETNVEEPIITEETKVEESKDEMIAKEINIEDSKKTITEETIAENDMIIEETKSNESKNEMIAEETKVEESKNEETKVEESNNMIAEETKIKEVNDEITEEIKVEESKYEIITEEAKDKEQKNGQVNQDSEVGGDMKE
ncbi:22502_t:CDS:10 [Dentiscutata erythropus]|uniref:22502_t:CDS:1 n=1 Tax=Dentiscutata erythropus TaxID=1348616 RepID=A0A9N9AVM3_9GLOM|nr:22502_t:CDS:10 [Dentiscutata erythropus]